MSAVASDITHDSMRYYLMQWARWCDSWRPNIGYPSAVPYIHGRMPLVPPGYADEGDTMTETCERIDAFAMRVIDAGVQNLPRPEYHALRYRYFLDQAPPSVRSHVIEQYRKLVNDAERHVAIFVSARGLQL